MFTSIDCYSSFNDPSRDAAARESRATPENPAYDLNSPELWDAFGGRESQTGIRVTHRKALSYSAVWQAVSLISGDIAKLPLNCHRRLDDQDRELAREHVAHRLVRRQPNRLHTAFDFWRTVMMHALPWGNAFVFIDRDGAGRPLELLPLLPDRTGAELIAGKLYYVTEINGKLEPIPAADVLHIKGISVDGLAGCDLIVNAREAIGLALASEGYGAKFFKHGSRTGGILELPANAGKPARDKIAEGFQKHHEGPENWFKTVVLRDGAKFHQTSITPNEGQMNETREHQVREICRFFNLAPSRLGVRDSAGYNSLTADNQSYLDSTLSPWLEAIAAQCYAKLLTPREQETESHYFEHNTKSLLRMSALERFQIYAIGTRSGVLLPDECRAAENMNKRPDGKGGELLPQPGAGFGPAGKGDGGADKQPADGASNKKGAVPADGGKPTEAKSADHSPDPLAERRVWFAIARHCRYKAHKPAAFIETIDGGMPNFRAELVAAGGDEQRFDALLDELQTVAANTTAERLYSAVETTVLAFELP